MAAIGNLGRTSLTPQPKIQGISGMVQKMVFTDKGKPYGIEKIEQPEDGVHKVAHNLTRIAQYDPTCLELFEQYKATYDAMQLRKNNLMKQCAELWTFIMLRGHDYYQTELVLFRLDHINRCLIEADRLLNRAYIRASRANMKAHYNDWRNEVGRVSDDLDTLTGALQLTKKIVYMPSPSSPVVAKHLRGIKAMQVPQGKEVRSRIQNRMRWLNHVPVHKYSRTLRNAILRDCYAIFRTQDLFKEWRNMLHLFGPHEKDLYLEFGQQLDTLEHKLQGIVESLEQTKRIWRRNATRFARFKEQTLHHRIVHIADTAARVLPHCLDLQSSLNGNVLSKYYIMEYDIANLYYCKPLYSFGSMYNDYGDYFGTYHNSEHNLVMSAAVYLLFELMRNEHLSNRTLSLSQCLYDIDVLLRQKGNVPIIIEAMLMKAHEVHMANKALSLDFGWDPADEKGDYGGMLQGRYQLWPK